MSNNIKFKIKRGEAKTVTFTVKDSANATVNLTGASVYFTVKRDNEEPIIDLGVCTLANQTTNRGEASYAITDTESLAMVNNSYKAEICVVDALNNTLFYPNNEKETLDYIQVIVSDSLAQP